MTTTTATPAELRKQRGAALAARLRITAKAPGVYSVPASSGTGHYTVEQDNDGVSTCTCPDYELRREPCKHAWAVEFSRRTETMSDGTAKVIETLRVTYRQNWPQYNAAQTNEKMHAEKLLRALCDGVAETPQTGRGQRRLPVSDRAFAVVMKVYEGMSARRVTTDMRDYASRGFLSKAPSYNSVIDYFDDPALTPVLRSLLAQSALPLAAVENDFAADSSGFTTCTYRRWFDEKYGREHSEARWIKAHIMIGVNTHIITAAEIGEEDSGDSPQLVPLTTATAERFTVREVLADKAYLSEKSAEAIVAMGATPYIPFKINSTGLGSRGHTGRTGGKLWRELFHFFSFNMGFALSTAE